MSAAEPPPRTGRRLALAGLLALAMGAGPLVNHGFAALSPVLIDELGLSATRYGALWTVVFGVGALCTVPGGRLVDRFGPRPAMVGVFAAAAAGLAVAAFAPSYVWLVVAAVLGGLSQAQSNPATNLIISRTVPAGGQGVVLGVKQSGVQVAQFLVGLTLPTMALWWGRDTGFLVLALLPVLGLLATRPLVGPAPARPGGARGSARERLPVHVWWVAAYAVVAGAAQQATNVYLPLYAHEGVGLPVARAGVLVAVVGGLGVVSRLLWGRGADRLPDTRAPLQWVAAVTVVAVTAMLAARWAGEWLLWAGATLFSAGSLAANVLIVLVVVRTVPVAAVGRASGWTSLALFGGFMLGPLLFGAMVDGTGGFVVPWVATGAAAVFLVLLTVVWRRVARAGGPAPA